MNNLCDRIAIRMAEFDAKKKALDKIVNNQEAKKKT